MLLLVLQGAELGSTFWGLGHSLTRRPRHGDTEKPSCSPRKPGGGTALKAAELFWEHLLGTFFFKLQFSGQQMF